jgi:hypothetical protein
VKTPIPINQATRRGSGAESSASPPAPARAPPVNGGEIFGVVIDKLVVIALPQAIHR